VTWSDPRRKDRVARLAAHPASNSCEVDSLKVQDPRPATGPTSVVPNCAAWPSTVGSRRAATGARRDPKTCRQTVTNHDRRFHPARPSHLGFLIGSHGPQCLGVPPGNAPWDLTRKRSQVQTLSRPPPFSHVKALLAPSLEHPLHTWAALGPRAHPRRQARWPCRARPRRRQAPRQPRNVVALQPRWQPRGGCGNVALQPAPLPGAVAGDGRPCGGLAPLVGRPQPPPRAQPRQVRGRRSPAGLHTTSAAVPHPGLPGPSTEPLGRGRTTWNSIRSRHEDCPAVPRCPPNAAAGLTRDQTDATADGRTPDGWTPGPGRMGGHRRGGRGRRRTAWQASWHPDHCDDAPTAGVPSGSSAGQTPPGRSATGTARQKGHCQGPGHRRDQTAVGHRRDQTAVGPLRRPAGALAHCCRVLDLDGTRGGQRDYGKVRGAGSGWVR
jgi:hypothetical protein